MAIVKTESFKKYRFSNGNRQKKQNGGSIPALSLAGESLVSESRRFSLFSSLSEKGSIAGS